MWWTVIVACHAPNVPPEGGVLAGLAEPAPPPAPPTVRVDAWPDDARVSLGPLSGTDRIDGTVEPGDWELVVERPGFEPIREAVSLAAGGVLVREVRLIGKPQPVVVTSHPNGARVRIVDASGAWTSVTPVERPVIAGPVEISIAADGMREERYDRFVDAPVTIDAWLDPEGAWLDLQRIYPTGNLPKGAAVSPDGRELWVAELGGPPSVVVHDLFTGERLGALSMPPSGTVEVMFADGGKTLYATQMETGKVFEIDVAARTVSRTALKVGKYPKVCVLSADGTRLYVANWLDNAVAEIDRATLKVIRRFPGTHTPRGLYPTPDGRWLYIAGFDDGNLWKVDLESGAVSVAWSGGRNLRHLASDGRTLYLSDMGAARIRAYDLQTGAMRALAKVDPNPNTIALSPDGRLLFVSSRGPNGPGGYLTESGIPGALTVIDTISGEVLDRAVAGSQPTALAVSPDGRSVVISDFREDQLRLYAIPEQLPPPKALAP